MTRIALFLSMIMLSFALLIPIAHSDHMDVTRPVMVTFGCESLDTVVTLVQAETETEVNAILAGAVCVKFQGGIPSKLTKYVGDAYDPMSRKTMEIYLITTIAGDEYYVITDKPGQAV